MRNYINIAAVILSALSVSHLSYAEKGVGSSGLKPHNGNSFQTKSSACAPAQGSKYLEYNNARARVETGGLIWLDRANGRADYEVPKNSGQFLIYSGALWVGGKDVNGQLKLAALKYRNSGNDFWTGPLSVTPNTGNPAIGTRDYGAATVDAQTCNEYDKFFITERQEIAKFNAWWECSLDPNCDMANDFPGYSIPASILNWPAHGDLAKFQDFYLAPFYDRDGDGVYNPTGAGDYPWYDLVGEHDCRSDRSVTLFGDYNMWWVFNDKGDVHTESGGDPIGMEIRAQAFAFATNDEVNNMTFYNYQLINRSTQTLTDTYFGHYTDVDLGCAGNDYAGCDIQRGLAFVYNAVDDDAASPGQISCSRPLTGIPAAIGIDFFEGPYQDNDGIDNPLTTDIAVALAQGGIPYKGLGIGYGDGVVDNERFGMRKFVFYNNSNNNVVGDPNSGSPTQFYNYLSGFWKDGSTFKLGGDANTTACSTTPVDYVYFGDTDPYLWATRGLPQSCITTPGGWTERGENNSLQDKRIVQSAGPFTLQPGATNNITVGVIYSKAQNGGAWQSVLDMRKADDKAQALFDNCFRIMNGPDAPDVTVQEMDKTIILYLSGTDEHFQEKDPLIEALGDTTLDIYYDFEGYQIYQVTGGDVGPSSLNDPTKARLVAQVDKKNGVGQIVNYVVDPVIGLPVPQLMVDGADKGIKHSFKITEDLFATGDSRLINHKKYYYIAISYGYNNYEDFNPVTGAGQDNPYFPSRKGRIGAIKPVVAIPHIASPENGGSVIEVEYGSGPKITQVEGRGNGKLILDLAQESEDEIVSTNYTPSEVTYDYNKGPVKIEVVDPLNVKGGDYELKFIKDAQNKLDSATWVLIRNGNESVFSDEVITVGNQQIIPDWGIAVEIEQYFYKKAGNKRKNILLEATREFGDVSKAWLSGVPDKDGNISQNWIRSGATDVNATNGMPACSDPHFFNDVFIGTEALDGEQVFEKILEGTWAPYRLTAKGDCNHTPVSNASWTAQNLSDLGDLSSVDIVITKDKSKWTRVPVVETQDDPALSWDGNTQKLKVKKMPSVDKYGNPTNDPTNDSGNPNDANYISGKGMSWFPGYAIDVKTGERLNMAFGEDSWLGGDNGNDMVFNPTNRMYTNLGNPSDVNSVVFGGKHYVYIFRNLKKDDKNGDVIGAYDNGEYMKTKLVNGTSTAHFRSVWKGCMYVGIPLLSPTAAGLENSNDKYSYIETDVKIRIRVANAYEQNADPGQYVIDGQGTSQNGWYNYYKFNMDDIATVTNADVTDSIKDSIMNLINVVPNPYYAYSNYETSRLDNRIKIVNLPDECTVSIYTVSGTLVRRFTKATNRVTSIDWNLTNQVGIPIAGGLYLIHVDVPSIGREKVLKWFGVIRPPELKNF